MDKSSKISLVEKILMMELAIIGDLSEALAALGIAIPIIGPALPLIAFIIGLTISSILTFWLIMKGVSVKWFLGGSGIELIPIINALPVRIAALAITFIEDSGPPIIKTAIKTATGGKDRK